MSLARSASGPAGLTINTGAANSLTNTQPASTGGLFGSTTSTPAATGNTAGATTTGTGNMFGSTTAGAAQGTGAAGGLFGGAKPAATSGGLFGGGGGAAPGTNTGTGGLFGAVAANPTQQNAGATGGLFGGGAANTTQQNAAPTGGLFGGGPAANTAQQNTGATGGLFGGGAAASAPAQQNMGTTAGMGLFGQAAPAANAQAPAATGGLFGQSQARPAGGLFGQPQAQSGAPGQPQANHQQQPQQQSQQQMSAVQVNYDNLRPRSRFDDLAKPVQDEIALIDKGIARVIKMKDEIGEFMPKHETDIAQLGRDVGFVESKFRTVQVALNRDIQTVKGLQDLTKKSIGDAQLSFKATDNLKLPTHYHQTGLFATQQATNNGGANSGGGGGSGASASSTHADAQDLITYFNRICDDVERYKRRLDEYRDAIERDMPGVENGLYEQIRTLRDRYQGGSGLGGDSMSDQLGQVLLALREMGTAIVNQAGQIADTRERLSRLQAGILDTGVYAASIAA